MVGKEGENMVEQEERPTQDANPAKASKQPANAFNDPRTKRRCCANCVYAYRKHHGKTLRMHQFIMNPPKGMVVDHIDGNGLDNRRCNLRICTRAQNAWNRTRHKPPGAASQYVGVHRYKKRPDKWYVKVQCGGDVTTLGPFDSEIEAARARDYRAVEAHGPYAHVNLPDEWPPERRAAVMEAARIRARAQLTELREHLAATRDAPLS
jgi:hypothetical protein